MAMAGGGGFRTQPLSRHSKTNMKVIEMFLPVTIEHEQGARVATVTVRRR